MNTTKTLNPSKLIPYEGSKLTLPQRFKLIKDGANVPSNTLFDPVLTKFFDKLPEATKKQLTPSREELLEDDNVKPRAKTGGKGLFTSTALFKPSMGEKFGEKLVWSDSTCSVTLIVPKVFSNLGNAGHDYNFWAIGIDLNKDNFDISTYDGRNIILEITERDARVIRLVPLSNPGNANASTLWIPRKDLGLGDGETSFESRELIYPLGVVAGLLMRMKWLNILSNINVDKQPSDRGVMLVVRD